MHKYKWYLIPIVTMLVFSLGSGIILSASQHSTNYIIEKDVVDGCGGYGSTTNYLLINTLGQPSPTSTSSSDAYFIYGGFRHPIQLIQLPDILVSLLSYTFDCVDVGEAASQTFIVTNEGEGDLKITNLSISGTDASQFSIQNDDCSGQTLGFSVARTVDVVFSPSSVGAKIASLMIPSNDPDTPTLNIELSGQGISFSPCPQPSGDSGGGSCFITAAGCID